MNLSPQQDLQNISAEKYFADLFTTGIKRELEVIAEKITKEAEAKFKKEADNLMKDWIYRMVRHFKVERREDVRSYRTEIVVQLPILEEIKQCST